jgi:hypothetical protein
MQWIALGYSGIEKSVICVCASVIHPPLSQLLLALQREDDWSDNPVVTDSWALSWAFKEAWDDAFKARTFGTSQCIFVPRAHTASTI